MDVAVKLEVHESPLSLVSEVKTKVPVFTKHIIRIDSSDHTPEHDYIQEKIYFTNSSVREALDEIKSEAIGHDAILVNPANLSTDIYSLKELARQKAIPFILYTP